MSLGLIALLGFIVIEICAKVRSEIEDRGFETENERLRATAFQALDITIAVLAQFKEVEGNLYGPSQGWGNPLAAAGVLRSGDDAAVAVQEALRESESPDGESAAAVAPAGQSRTSGRVMTEEARLPIILPAGIELSIEIIDETGKFPLAAATEERLLIYFSEMGFDETEAKILTDSLLDWTDGDNSTRPSGAERDFYEQREPPYRPPNRPLRQFSELRLIRGFEDLFFSPSGAPNSHYWNFIASFSLVNDGEINLNTASDLTVATYAEEYGFDEGRLEEFLAGRDGERGTSLDRTLTPGTVADDLPLDKDGNPPNRSVFARFLWIRIEAAAAGTHYRLAALIDTATPDPDGNYPFTFIDFRENLQPIEEMPL